jgi:hypothetical protein
LVRRVKMSVKMMHNVFERSLTTGNARLVLIALADACSDEGVCFPSLKTIARKANVSEETTRKFLHAFEKIGLVESEERFAENGRRTSNTYTLLVDKIGEDNITKSIVYSAIPKSKHRTGDGMNQFIPTPSEPVQTIPPMNQFIPSIMNHQKEPSKEPSDGFVADAPKTIASDLFPTDDCATPKTSSPRIAERSSMDSRSLQSAITSADFKARANRLLGRRDTTAWSAAELRAAKPHLQTCEEDWKLLENFYAKRGEKDVFTRRSMLTLLNNWAGEIDKARSMFPPAPQIPDEKLDPVAAGLYWANVKPNE